MNKLYPITRLEHKDTQYGLCIKTYFKDGETAFTFFLTRSIQMSPENIFDFNEGNEDISLICKGKDKDKFIIKFV